MKKEQKHICFDLETLGNNPASPIIQIGAVKFDIDGIYDKFQINVKYDDINEFRLNYSTIMWWMSQHSNAINSLSVEPVVDLKTALNLFFEWVGVIDGYLFWSHATFDGPILRTALDVLNLGDKIPYRNYRDVRTIVDLFDIDIPKQTEDALHIAINDAEYEATQVIYGLTKYFNYKRTFTM